MNANSFNAGYKALNTTIDAASVAVDAVLRRIYLREIQAQKLNSWVL